MTSSSGKIPSVTSSSVPAQTTSSASSASSSSMQLNTAPHNVSESPSVPPSSPRQSRLIAVAKRLRKKSNTEDSQSGSDSDSYYSDFESTSRAEHQALATTSSASSQEASEQKSFSRSSSQSSLFSTGSSLHSLGQSTEQQLATEYERLVEQEGNEIQESVRIINQKAQEQTILKQQEQAKAQEYRHWQFNGPRLFTWRIFIPGYIVRYFQQRTLHRQRLATCQQAILESKGRLALISENQVAIDKKLVITRQQIRKIEKRRRKFLVLQDETLTRATQDIEEAADDGKASHKQIEERESRSSRESLK